jgi:hypothetical protein
MKHTYFQVVEYQEEEKRRIYTFDNEMAAHDMIEFILKHDPMPIDLRVEEYDQITT